MLVVTWYAKYCQTVCCLLTGDDAIYFSIWYIVNIYKSKGGEWVEGRVQKRDLDIRKLAWLLDICEVDSYYECQGILSATPCLPTLQNISLHLLKSTLS